MKRIIPILLAFLLFLTACNVRQPQKPVDDPDVRAAEGETAPTGAETESPETNETETDAPEEPTEPELEEKTEESDTDDSETEIDEDWEDLDWELPEPSVPSQGEPTVGESPAADVVPDAPEDGSTNRTRRFPRLPRWGRKTAPAE